MKTFVVIGLGRFGRSVAEELYELGHEVLAIDEQEDQVQAVADSVTHAVVGDAMDESVLRSLGVRNLDCAIVGIGSDITASIIITLTLKELGVREVIAKAMNSNHAKALEKIGADKVVFPEREMGLKLARSLSSSNILDFIELSDKFGIAEIEAPKVWRNKSIVELDIRARHSVNIIAVMENGNLSISPNAQYVIKPGDVLVMLGSNEDLGEIRNL